jgi:uncharacterized membrane protein
MPIFLAFHILSMFTMVTLFSGGEFFYVLAIRQRDVHALAWLHRTAHRTRFPFVAIGALVAGVAFGLLTAATGGFDFLDGWLIAAYLLVALFFVNATVIGKDVIQLADKAVEADAGQRPVEEVAREMAATNRATLLFVVNVAIFAAIILDMVLKPF